MAPRESENNAYENFEVTNKEHYMVCNGIFWSGSNCANLLTHAEM